jgi:hypothetical protein
VIPFEDEPMPYYVVTLDLHRGAKQHYDDLTTATAELDCCRPFEVVLIVCSSWTAEQLHAYLRPHVDPMDDLTVDLMAEGQAWTGWVHDEVAREWLTKHLGSAT